MGFFKIFSISLFSQGAVLFIGFINSIIITRNLGVDGRGQYAIAMNVITILALVFGDGLYRSNTYLVSIERKNLSPLFTNGTLAVMIFSSLLLSLPFLIGRNLIEIVLPGLNPTLISLAILIVTPVIYLRSVEGLLLGLQKYYVFNSLVVAPLFLYMLFNIGLFFFTFFTPARVLANYLVAMGIVVMLSLFWLLSSEKVKFKPNWKIGRESITKGLKASTSHICLFLLFRVDIFLLNYFLGIKQAGLYSIAVLISELLQKMANTSATVIFPKLTGKQSIEGRRLSLNVLTFILLVGIIFSMFIVIFGKQIIILLYKKKFAESAGPLYFLLPGTVIMAGGKIMLFSLWAQNFPRITVIVPLLTFFLNTALNLLLIPKFGINGAAISTSLSYTIFGIALGGYYFTHKQLSPSQEVVEIESVE